LKPDPVSDTVSGFSNHFALSAQIDSLKTLRYTPAGLPALDLELSHESEVEEAGQKRQVKLVVKAVALGSLAEALVKQHVGSRWCFSGFLAASRNKPQPSRQLVFHIQAFQAEVILPSISAADVPTGALSATE
jgi:primosomal replication protein N